MKDRKLFGKLDVLIIAVVLVIFTALALPLLFQKGDTVATVYYDGKVIEEINLSKNRENRDITAGKCIIRLEGNEIFFLKSDCPDKICVKSGRLSKGGQFASCVPEKVTVILKGKGAGSEPDAITY